MNILIFVVGIVLLSGISFRKREAVVEPLSMDVSLATKGIAAIAVMLTHCSYKIGNTEHPLLGFGYLSVSLFFFWSGYGMVRSADNKANYLKVFWQQRLTKLFVPFLVAAILYHIGRELLGVGGSFAGIISVLRTDDLVDNSWYVFALLAFMGLFYGWQKLFDQKKQSSFVAIVVGVILLTVLEWVLGKAEAADFWTYSNLAFLIGIAIWRFDPSMKFRKWYLMGLPIVGFIFYAAHLGFKVVFGHYSNFVMVLSNNGVSACAVLLALTALSYIGKPNPVALFLGKYSYEIYLMHGLMIRIVNAIAISNNFWVNIVLVVCATVLVSVPLHILNQKLIDLILKRKPIKKE